MPRIIQHIDEKAPSPLAIISNSSLTCFYDTSIKAEQVQRVYHLFSVTPGSNYNSRTAIGLGKESPVFSGLL